jgi:uncharacterized protein YbjT (DUF2867 family)
MKVILFGASGMVGQGVLLECLESTAVERVLAIGRSPSGLEHDKLRELVRADLFSYADVQAELTGYDACFFCLGVSSAGMSQADYTRVTYDLTMAAAKALQPLNPGMTFCYVSGAGTDSTGEGSAMWRRVKGKTENELLALCFKGAFMFRPGYIHPMKGVTSRTRLYRAAYAVLRPLYPVLKAVTPKSLTTSENMGRAMIKVAQQGDTKHILENEDINRLAA